MREMKTNRQGTVTSTQRVAIILRKARVRQRSPGSVVTMIKQFFLCLAQGKNDKIISTCTYIIVINTSTENILPLDNTILCTITYIACGLPQTLQPLCQSYPSMKIHTKHKCLKTTQSKLPGWVCRRDSPDTNGLTPSHITTWITEWS